MIEVPWKQVSYSNAPKKKVTKKKPTKKKPTKKKVTKKKPTKKKVTKKKPKGARGGVAKVKVYRGHSPRQSEVFARFHAQDQLRAGLREVGMSAHVSKTGGAPFKVLVRQRGGAAEALWAGPDEVMLEAMAMRAAQALSLKDRYKDVYVYDREGRPLAAYRNGERVYGHGFSPGAGSRRVVPRLVRL